MNKEISEYVSKNFPNNCPMILRTADGDSVGPCWYFLKDGKTCPKHGVVKLLEKK